MIPAVETLDAVWKQWCDFVQGQGVHLGRYDQQTEASTDAYQPLHQRLLSFTDRHPDAPEHLHTVIVALSKGTHLVKAALAWEEAAAGPGAQGGPTSTSQARGEQWRLVMGYGGLETVFEALLSPHPRFPSYYQGAKHFSDCCALPAYAPLDAPSQHRGELAQWLKTEVTSDEHPLVRFLGLNNGDAGIFRAWIIEGRPVDSWPAALLLAKALRNATAHGALSASKVRQWGLRDALETLCINLGELTAGALRRLVEIPLKNLKLG